MLTRETILALYESDGIEAVVTAVVETQSQLLERNRRLEERVAVLEERLGLDSRNSSKPPSSDPPGTNRAERRRQKQATKKKRSGNGGATLRRIENPGKVVVHAPSTCACCGRDLSRRAVEETGAARQVFDIEPVTVTVVEHRTAARRCRCGATTTARFAEQVTAPAQYGPNLLSLGLLLMSGHHLPVRRTCSIIEELSGLRPSEATLLSAVERLDAAIDAPFETIIGGLLDAHQLFVDETGMNVDGKLWWLHIIATRKLTLLAIDRHRGREAIEAIGLLTEYDGYLMHDYWASYTVAERALHGYCCAHLLRELVRCSERSSDGTHRFAEELMYVLIEAIAARRRAVEAKASAVDAATVDSLRRRYSLWVTRGLALFGPSASGPNTHEHRLLRRLRDDRDEILAFLLDVSLEPTNNIAERGFRFAKIREKISGCFRSETMAHTYARVQSYLLTARKQGATLYEAIRGALTGEPFMPATAGT